MQFSQIYQTQMTNHCKKSSKNLQEFEADFARLIRLTYPSAPEYMIECLAVQMLVSGLCDRELQRSLRLAPLKTMKDTLTINLEHKGVMEAFRSHAWAQVRTEEVDLDKLVEKAIQQVMEVLSKKKQVVHYWNCGGHQSDEDHRTPRNFEGSEEDWANQRTEKEKWQLRTAAGEKAALQREAMVCMTLGRVNFDHPVIVAKIEDVYQASILVSPNQKQEASKLITRYQEIFKNENGMPGKTKFVTHKINTEKGSASRMARGFTRLPQTQELLDAMGLVSGGGWHSKMRTGEPGWNGAEAAAGCSFEQDPGSIMASGRHLGFKKTLQKVHKLFYWANCSEDVKDCCRKCATCFTSNKPKKRPKAPMRQYNIGSPFQRIAMNIAGPFQGTRQGNKYILVTMDYLTKY
ncbi:hypothetical protein J437_LFUL015430 [Ladona fulva]|uniref:Integrase zinc-binding domain-containing protein n=1 Tax=Ladona fulva TaxID=123851 RepID=A0A8K0KIX1_LADFU|nr:hypothetical protein J437_LFUL015430 [Ladona fulva]